MQEWEFLVFQMWINYNSQHPQSAWLIMKSPGSCMEQTLEGYSSLIEDSVLHLKAIGYLEDSMDTSSSLFFPSLPKIIHFSVKKSILPFFVIDWLNEKKARGKGTILTWLLFFLQLICTTCLQCHDWKTRLQVFQEANNSTGIQNQKLCRTATFPPLLRSIAKFH